MKSAMDSFLKGSKPAGGMEMEGADDAELDSMFGEEGPEEEDPLMQALQTAGYPVDEAKLGKIRAILDEGGEEGGEAFGGTESAEEEAAEAEMGGGLVPAGKKPKF